jgi:MoxR-like ATPase
VNSILLTVIAAAMDARIVPLLWGDPGIGKSAFVETLARKRGNPIEVVIGSVREPSDFAGLPIVTNDNDVIMAPPRWVKHLNGDIPGLNERGGGIAFLDEITTAPPAVQAAMLRVVLDRYVGDVKLHEDVRIVAAANPPSIAADGWDLAPPLANRFLHLDVGVNPEIWRQGMTAGWDSTIPDTIDTIDPTDSARASALAQVNAFASNKRSDLLHAMPDDESSQGRAWPSPRTWDFVAQILPRFNPDSPDYKAAVTMAVTGLVGEGAGLEFVTWRERMDLPDPVDVLADPTVMNWKADADKVFAVLSSVVTTVLNAKDPEQWEPAWEVLATCAKEAAPDIAATSAEDLLRGRWDKNNNALRMPESGKVFRDILVKSKRMGA